MKGTTRLRTHIKMISIGQPKKETILEEKGERRSHIGRDSPSQSGGNMAPHRSLRMDVQPTLDVAVPVPPHSALPARAFRINAMTNELENQLLSYI